MSQSETVETSRSIFVDQAVLWDIVNVDVDRQVPDRLNDSIETTIEGTLMHAIQLETVSVDFEKKWTLNSLIDSVHPE